MKSAEKLLKALRGGRIHRSRHHQVSSSGAIFRLGVYTHKKYDNNTKEVIEVPELLPFDESDDIDITKYLVSYIEESFIDYDVLYKPEEKPKQLSRKIYTNEGDLTEIRKYINRCLNKDRADNYDEWLKLGFVLFNIDDRLLDDWIEFSKQSSKFIEGECEKQWDNMKKTDLGLGTLKWWAKKDNIIEYNNILNENVAIYIDICIGSEGAHYDVANVLFRYCKDNLYMMKKMILGIILMKIIFGLKIKKD